jgi:GNAT superfamily N-acetyltransferase
MIIRTITPEEGPEFLALMCKVFDLEVSRAQSVFYKEPLFDLSRKWALFDGGEIVSILTTVPLIFGWGRGFGIAGVATRDDCRGRGYASMLLEQVCKHGEATGESAAYLFANETSVYERNNFRVVDSVIRGPIERIGEPRVPAMLDGSAIEERYAAWASQDPNRLRRDDHRWRYWRWSLRVCTEFGDGYLCSEGSVIREVVLDSPLSPPWQTPEVEWLGLESVTNLLKVPLKERHFELHVMARNAPEGLAMFMTDQF